MLQKHAHANHAWENAMKTMTDPIVNQLDREVDRTRRVLERVPDGRYDWKPHDKSMPFGRLAMLVATMPSWITMILNKDELDLNPPGGGSSFRPPDLRTSHELVEGLERGAVEAREALSRANEDQLAKPWRLLVAGKVVSEDPRSTVIRDTLMHWSHHRGQLTVYLRLNEVPVPAIYGPSADETRFD